jgi:hypothetical protein
MPEPLPPLPDLPVRRETYCSQNAVDQATRFLVRRHEDLLQQMRQEDCNGYHMDRSEAAWELLEALQAGATDIDMPAGLIGRLDLACEIIRRLRKADGRQDLRPRGIPLGEAPDRLRPLCGLDIAKQRMRRLTQEQVDDVLQVSYAANPELWFATAEECRIDLQLDATQRFRSALQTTLLECIPGVGIENFTLLAPSEIYHEAMSRIIRMCRLDGRPLAAGPDQPLPPLIDMELSPATVELGLTPWMVLLVLKATYRARPDLWYGTGEWARFLEVQEPRDALRELVGATLTEMFPEASGPRAKAEVFSEAYRRIYRMCGMED